MTESNNNQASFSDTEMDDEILAKKLYRLESGKKEIQQIENSRAWKLGSKVKSTNVDSDSSSNEEIKNRLATIQSSIYTLQTELNRLRMDDRLLNTYQMMQTLTDEHQKGNLIDFIEDLVNQKKVHDQNYPDTFHHAI